MGVGSSGEVYISDVDQQEYTEPQAPDMSYIRDEVAEMYFVRTGDINHLGNVQLASSGENRRRKSIDVPLPKATELSKSEFDIYLSEDEPVLGALSEGLAGLKEFNSLIESRLEYFNYHIEEKQNELRDYLFVFLSAHEELANQNVDLEAFNKAGMDVNELAKFVQGLELARESYIRYLIDLVGYLMDMYPALNVTIAT